jgi:flotillin
MAGLPIWLFLIVALAGIVAAGVIGFATRYKRCPSDHILVVYGKVGKAAGKEEARVAKCIHGGGTFVIPLIQDYAFLPLRPITIDINLTKALSKENIRVNAPSTFTIGISTEPTIMSNAAERLLNLQAEDIKTLAEDIILGQFRATIASMEIEEINRNREAFQKAVMENVEIELKKVGLRVINVNIKDLTDESGYIDALGKRAAAEAINQAMIDVAEQQRKGETGQATAVKEKEVAVADAVKEQRVGVANANATAVTGENEAKQKIIESGSKLRQANAEFERQAVAAEKTKNAEALTVAFTAEQKAEVARTNRDTQTEIANAVPLAEASKQKKIIEADADAEAMIRKGKGEGEQIKLKMEGEAAGITAIMNAQATGIENLVKAAGGNSNAAFMLMMVDKMPGIVKMQTEAIKGIKIDKTIVWDSGKGEGVGNFVQGLFKSLPPISDLLNTAGMALPDALNGAVAKEPEKSEPKAEKKVA